MELYRRSDSDKWWLTYSIGGQRFRESTKTANKRQAKAYLAMREVENSEGRFFPEKKKGELTLKALGELWFEAKHKKRSLDKDRQRFGAIVEYFGPSKLVMSITAEDCAKLRADLLKRKTRRGGLMASSTVNRYPAVLRGALNSVRDSHHHQDPMRKMKELEERNERDRECHPDEFERLIGAAEPRLRLAIGSLATGARTNANLGCAYARRANVRPVGRLFERVVGGLALRERRIEAPGASGGRSSVGDADCSRYSLPSFRVCRRSPARSATDNLAVP